MADVIREALSVFWWLAKEYRQGNRLLIQRGEQVTELMIPSLARMTADTRSVETAGSRATEDVPVEPRADAPDS